MKFIKKQLRIMPYLILTITILLFSNICLAAPIYVGGTNDLTLANGWNGTLEHNDKLDNINWLVDFYDGTIDSASTLSYPLTLLGKWDTDNTVWENNNNPGFTGDFSGSSGTWNASGSTQLNNSIFYSIKAGSDNSGGGFELYFANGDTSGTWNTSGLSNHGLSHVSFWAAENNPVPEPTTMLLFGLGLLGVAGVSRKKK